MSTGSCASRANWRPCLSVPGQGVAGNRALRMRCDNPRDACTDMAACLDRGMNAVQRVIAKIAMRDHVGQRHEMQTPVQRCETRHAPVEFVTLVGAMLDGRVDARRAQ